MSHPLRRTLVAVATACAVLFAMATPASATTYTVTATVTGGTVEFDGGSPIPLTSGVCGVTSTLQAVVDNAADTIEITTFFSRTKVTLGTTTYVVDTTAESFNRGEYNPGDPSTIGHEPDDDIEIILYFDFWTLATGPCTKGSYVCQVGAAVALGGGYQGNLDAPNVAHTFMISGFDIGGGAAQTEGTCTLGPATLLGDEVTVIALAGTVTNVV